MTVHPHPLGAVSDSKALRRALAAFPTGVTVVTVGGPTPHAMTANSFTAVSLDPPLALVCVGRDAVMHGALTEAGRFGISVLAASQEPVARYFADRRRPLGREQFEFGQWQAGAQTGSPLLVGAVAHFECELWQAYDGGDHSIFVGRLVTLDRTDGEPLLFADGRFRRLEYERTGVTT
ncbi:flavin reductase family protein [Micromonospora sp. NPDC048871]|uniref:flavin reductase family protein n=1 Tax=unclassified Micromonospora TaxID=2617518 RepID=UPI003715051F